MRLHITPIAKTLANARTYRGGSLCGGSVSVPHPGRAEQRQMDAKLRSGPNILITGTPGTGKTATCSMVRPHAC